MPMEHGRRQGVVAIECVAGGSRAEEWGPGSSETVQTGDVVEEILIGVGGRGGPAAHAAPFKGGRAAVQRLLHSAYKRGDTSVEVRVRRPAHAQQLVTTSGELLPSPRRGGDDHDGEDAGLHRAAGGRGRGRRRDDGRRGPQPPVRAPLDP